VRNEAELSRRKYTRIILKREIMIVILWLEVLAKAHEREVAFGRKF
jgi:hypothetical protein